MANEIKETFLFKGEELKIYDGFPTDHPSDQAGRPNKDDDKIIAEAISGLQSGKYKSRNNALDMLTEHLDADNKNTAMWRLKCKLKKAMNNLSNSSS